MLCQISLKYVQKPFQRNKPAKVQAYNGKIKCFIRKRALILLFTYIYRHWKANLTEVMIVEFNQGQRGLAGPGFSSAYPSPPCGESSAPNYVCDFEKVTSRLTTSSPLPTWFTKWKRKFSPWLCGLQVLAAAQLCLTLCDPMDWGPPGSSVLGSLQARILEWVVIPFSRGSAWPRDSTWVSCTAGRFFTMSATRKIPGCVV